MSLSLPPLYGIADLGGALDPDDSATLRFFCEAARRVPLRVLIDEDNRDLCVYTRPEPLRKLIEHAAGAAELGDDDARPRSESPAVSPEVAASRAAMDLSEPPPAVVERDGALAFTQPPELDNEEPTPESDPLAARASQRDSATPLHIGDLAEALVKSLTEPDSSPPVRAEKLTAEAALPTDGERANARVEVERELANQQGHSNTSSASSRANAASELNANASAEASEKPAISVPPLYPNAADEWRGWLRDLVAARGPKPLSAIERMFVTSYVPLRTAQLMGHGDADARRALETWSTSFAQSYHDAFDALRVRGKRPSMVLDVPEIALRIGRLHGARSVQLVLVDGMRFDLGLRVEQRVRALVGQQAALTERLLLWSALPATTEVQLDLIGRGAEGLRDPSPPAETEVPVARGRAAATLRRVKTGYRDLLKLDLVEAKLAETGADEATRLDSLADDASHVLAEHLVKQAPRTLVVAFGDHGYLLERLESGGTARAKSGGATPEEVLVPAFAWLVGGVH
jgi:hypothetical protein